ncbi:MAG: ArnT family glycosyltransferase, partial [Tepidisphaeraceae bacterium]
MKRAGIVFSGIGLAMVIALIFGVRWFGPHDLYEKDQPKTMAYTADMLVNGRWSLPRDVIYQPATKPPVYNWIDAAAVKATGSWTEWVLKFPSILGSLATGAIVLLMTRRQRRDDGGNGWVAGMLAAAIWFTFGSDIRHGSVLRLGYLARPDMLQCAFLTAAWACATVALQRESRRRARAPALGFWVCVTLAALTKGPAAVMPIVYAVLFALPPMRKPRSVADNLKKLHILVGLAILAMG